MNARGVFALDRNIFMIFDGSWQHYCSIKKDNIMNRKGEIINGLCVIIFYIMDMKYFYRIHVYQPHSE